MLLTTLISESIEKMNLFDSRRNCSSTLRVEPMHHVGGQHWNKRVV